MLEPAVPQIWMTYAEFGALVGCDCIAARATAQSMMLDRRRSRDGQTRVKLDARLAEAFHERAARAWIERQIGAGAAELFALADRMAAREQGDGRKAASAG